MITTEDKSYQTAHALISRNRGLFVISHKVPGFPDIKVAMYQILC